jgi:hypothetical protein
MSIDMFSATPRQMKTLVSDCIEVGLVPFVTSDPGMGKSAIMHNVCDDYGLHMVDHRMSTSIPEDFSGLPRFTEDGKARFAPFDEIFPMQDTPIPDGKEGFMLFLDEFNSCERDVQAAAYKPVLDHFVGQHPLHERCVITAAGNLTTSNAIVNDLSTAMQSRVIHINLRIDWQEWLEDVALAQNYDNRLVTYLARTKGEELHDFRPEHQDRTFCCPRTWSFINRFLKNKPELTDLDATLFGGTITSGVAASFVQYTKVSHKVPTLARILREAETLEISHSNDINWATVGMLMSNVDEKNFGTMAKYIDRMSLDFRILFYRGVKIRQPALEEHPAFKKAFINLARYLNGTTSPTT